jgi:hypothetical protein
MFSTPYPSLPQLQAYAVRAHRMRGAVVATLVQDLVRWFSAASR